MKFGICGSIENAAAIKAAGADFLEVGVQAISKPAVPDAEWTVPTSPLLPMRAANVLLPGDVRVTGPDVDPAKQRTYLERVLKRMSLSGITTIVFGSGGARKIPDGFSRETAWSQIVAFGKILAEIAQKNGITIVAEPLNKLETNILNSTEETAQFVEAVGHPSLRLLVDSYHFWMESDPLDVLKKRLPMIRHVHVADNIVRTYPGVDPRSDYGPFFKVLKDGGYSGLISIEALGSPPPDALKQSMDFIRQKWNS